MALPDNIGCATFGLRLDGKGYETYAINGVFENVEKDDLEDFLQLPIGVEPIVDSEVFVVTRRYSREREEVFVVFSKYFHSGLDKKNRNTYYAAAIGVFIEKDLNASYIFEIIEKLLAEAKTHHEIGGGSIKLNKINTKKLITSSFNLKLFLDNAESIGERKVFIDTDLFDSKSILEFIDVSFSIDLIKFSALYFSNISDVYDRHSNLLLIDDVEYKSYAEKQAIVHARSEKKTASTKNKNINKDRAKNENEDEKFGSSESSIHENENLNRDERPPSEEMSNENNLQIIIDKKNKFINDLDQEIEIKLNEISQLDQIIEEKIAKADEENTKLKTIKNTKKRYLYFNWRFAVLALGFTLLGFSLSSLILFADKLDFYKFLSKVNLQENLSESKDNAESSFVGATNNVGSLVKEEESDIYDQINNIRIQQVEEEFKPLRERITRYLETESYSYQEDKYRHKDITVFINQFNSDEISGKLKKEIDSLKMSIDNLYVNYYLDRINEFIEQQNFNDAKKITQDMKQVLGADIFENHNLAIDKAAYEIEKKRNNTTIHIVRNNQSLSSIGDIYKVNLEDIYELNGLSSTSLIRVGQNIIIRE